MGSKKVPGGKAKPANPDGKKRGPFYGGQGRCHRGGRRKRLEGEV